MSFDKFIFKQQYLKVIGLEPLRIHVYEGIHEKICVTSTKFVGN